MMRWFAFVFSFASIGVAACGDNMPPIIGEGDSGQTKDVYVAPCSQPTAGCPCAEAGVSEVCGTEFHTSGGYTTCSKQYITCGGDGTWGPCIGAFVFGAE